MVNDITTKSNHKGGRSFLDKYALLIVFITLCCSLAIITPHFLTVENLLNIFRQSSIIGLIAVGTTFVIVGASFDISVGSVLALCGAVVIGSQAYIPWPLAIAACLFLGGLIGFINGILSVKIGAPSIIVTLSTMVMVRGVVYLYTGGYPEILSEEASPSFHFLGNGSLGPFPFPVILLLLCGGLGEFVLQKTKFGRYLCAIGGNKEAARLSGIKVDFYHIASFCLGGVLTALASIVYASRLLSVTPLAGQGYEMDAIAATVIGGTSVSGGSGSVFKTFIGVLLLGIISNVFNLLGIQVYAQYVIKGAIILAAVGSDVYSRKKS